MLITFREFKLNVMRIENRAKMKVPKIFPVPVFSPKRVEVLVKKLLKEIRPEINEAYVEGLEFGKVVGDTVFPEIKGTEPASSPDQG
jgi:hypothetical protein